MAMETYFDVTSLGWLNYVALTIAIVILCGGACVCTRSCECVNCCALFRAVFHCLVFSLTTLKRLLVTAQPVDRLPVVNEPPALNHYILDIRPYHGVNISQIISDIVDVLNQALPDYPAPEKQKKHRRPPRKFVVKGWRRKLNERWKKKIKFIKAMLLYARDVSNNDFQDESKVGSDRVITENSTYSHLVWKSYSNSRESQSEEFYVGPYMDEDYELTETILPVPIRILTMFKAKPDGTLDPNWE